MMGTVTVPTMGRTSPTRGPVPAVSMEVGPVFPLPTAVKKRKYIDVLMI